MYKHKDYIMNPKMERLTIDFVQHVRSLSRRHFMLRALIRKARATAGLP